MDSLEITGLWICIFMGVVACIGWLLELRRSAVERAARAEIACAEMRDQLMRGASVATWHRPKPVPPGADSFYFRLRTTHGDLLLTEEALAVARDRATKLL